MLKIYLAGPEVFLPNPLEVGKQKKEIYSRYGFIGCFPMDNDVENFKNDQETGFRISSINENLIRQCDIVVANLTPFRGVSADPGTVYELGFSKGLGKIVHGYSFNEEKYLDRASKNNQDDTYSIENFDLHDNLMIEGGIHNGNGIFVALNGENLDVFEHIVNKLHKIVNK